MNAEAKAEPEPHPAAGAAEIAARVRGGASSAVAEVRAALRAVARGDTGLNAFAEVWPRAAQERAAHVDAALARGADLPLAGVPIGVKAWEGTASLQARRLVAAGAVPVGATSVPGPGTPWRTWGTTDRGRTANPWRADATPGGSSAGSGAAVGAGLVPLATAGDGAGSTRIPAAWCGAVGYKPTTGLLPARDPAGLAVGGPIARTVADVRLYARVVLGAATDGPGAAGARTGAGTVRPGRLRVVWSSDLGFAEVDPEIEHVAHTALLAWARGSSARPVPVNPADASARPGTSAPDGRDREGAQAAAAGGGAGGRGGRWGVVDVVAAGLDCVDPAGEWFARREAPGRAGAAEGDPDRGAGSVAGHNRARLDALFSGADLLATPTTPNRPHGHDGPGEVMSVALTWLFNITGHPAISLPAGFTADGLPVGLHLVAPHHRDGLLLRAAADYQAVCPWPPTPWPSTS
ncbi:amidase [Streptomonospora sp. S1-112]|uniref:Amidase n=1 Tax=Streptomonospora mangrovi TaxID=2883123 RepID=A0A9X3SRJ2_9ACTN|nr:amidase [Streptomonospora mangrovi]MDA0567371.1 amidase [Streptomonospora mangrovi]